jgi:hypothetical protein
LKKDIQVFLEEISVCIIIRFETLIISMGRKAIGRAVNTENPCRYMR